jgi:hypothetical protein
MNSINYSIDNLQYCNWSENTFVPENESLKNSAAGAGLLDND